MYQSQKRPAGDSLSKWVEKSKLGKNGGLFLIGTSGHSLIMQVGNKENLRDSGRSEIQRIDLHYSFFL